MQTGEEGPSPALLAARERSRLAEEKLRSHLTAGGSTGSFKQQQPAEITQAIPDQTYQSLEAGDMSSQQPYGGSRPGARFTGTGADAVQLARAHARESEIQQASSGYGGQGYRGSGQRSTSPQPQYNQYNRGQPQYNQASSQYPNQGQSQYTNQDQSQYNNQGNPSQYSNQGNQGQQPQNYGQDRGDFQQSGYDQQAPPVKQYPRGGSLPPSAYSQAQGQGPSNYSSDRPGNYSSERSDRSPGNQYDRGAASGGYNQQQNAPSGPFHQASQGYNPDTEDTESEGESVRMALQHARLRSRELPPGEGKPGSSTDTTYFDEEISLAPSDSIRDSTDLGDVDDVDSVTMALRHARAASQKQDHPTPGSEDSGSSIPRRRGAPTNYAVMQIYNAMPTSIVEQNPAAAKRAAEKVADENRVRATYIPALGGMDHRANVERQANTQGLRSGYQAGRQIDLPSQRVPPSQITPPPMSPGQVYRSESDSSSVARAPETTPAANAALPPTEQNVQAGPGGEQGEQESVLGKTMNNLGDAANWMLGRDQTAPNDSLESGTTTTGQRTIDANPKDPGQKAAEDIASRTVYVDLAPAAWSKVKAYGRAGIEMTGDMLQATGQAMHTKAQLIETKPEDMEVAHQHLSMAGEQVASVLPGGSDNQGSSRATSQSGSQSGSQAGSQSTAPRTQPQTQPQTQTHAQPRTQPQAQIPPRA